MSIFNGYTVNDGHYYKVLPNGSAPPNLGIGDLVVTAGGTYLITVVRVSDGINPLIPVVTYQSILYDVNLTINNFTGTYLDPPQVISALQRQAEASQIATGGSIVKGAAADLFDFEVPDNYIYFYHLDQFILLPLHADSIQDQMGVSFEATTPLSRSAPIFSYRNSGPRTVQINFDLHRDLMTDLNYKKSNVPVGPQLAEDYVDILINYIQAAALPVYSTADKMVNPPLVALRMGNDIFIKGVVQGSVGLTYKFPILKNGKYALVSVGFQIAEVDPYDAWDAVKFGSYRGLDTTLDARLSGKGLDTSATTRRDTTISSGSGVSAFRIESGINKERQFEEA